MGLEMNILEDFRERHVSSGVAVGMLERDLGGILCGQKQLRNSLIILMLLIL